jgi:hypothetical protein
MWKDWSHFTSMLKFLITQPTKLPQARMNQTNIETETSNEMTKDQGKFHDEQTPHNTV